ncbi:MAG: glycosyltransferase family 4 protein, partial [Bacteroidales bacterium]|nr:glycosyltransferase family 4 protein [Bacteroidales bacterium]
LHYKLTIAPLQGSALRYKFDFLYKIARKYRALKATVSLNEIEMTCAATLFSEGAVAYRLYKKHAIPYAVMIRNTDYNFYFQKMVHLWPLGKKILRHAQKVIFIAPYYRQATLRLPLLRSLKTEIEQKSVLISNGIDPFWCTNRWQRTAISNPHKILFVGNFNKGKNVPVLVKACASLKKQYPDLELHISGGGGTNVKKVEALIAKHEWIFFYGRIMDKERLKQLYRSCDIYAMPSHETFGLVFIEALTQCIPVIYGKDSGFDYRYEEGKVGYAAIIGNVQNISEKLALAIQNYSQLITQIQQLNFDSYNWNTIAAQLITQAINPVS